MPRAVQMNKPSYHPLGPEKLTPIPIPSPTVWRHITPTVRRAF